MSENRTTIAAAIGIVIILSAWPAWAVDWSKPVQYYKDGKRYDLLCHPPPGPKIIDDQGYSIYENMKCDILKVSPE